MGELKQILATSVKKGTSLVIDGIACSVSSVQISKPGKHGHAKVRIEASSLIDRKKKIIVVPGHDKLQSPVIEKKTAQVLSLHGDTANVMDSETYETFDLPVPEELRGKLTEGVTVSYWIILDQRVMKEIKG